MVDGRPSTWSSMVTGVCNEARSGGQLSERCGSVGALRRVGLSHLVMGDVRERLGKVEISISAR